jgi:polar amino acid transport system substrate-binding protein/arginine/ornithine transport system substrate-binding protein
MLRSPILRRTVLAALAAAAVAAPALSADKLRIGVEGNYPPFSQVSPDGKLSGFDIDIAEALCAEMKADCELVQQEWDGMIPALNAKKFDLIVASMTITEKRREQVDFSNPYYDVPSRFVAPKGAFADWTPETLKGKTIIVLRNSPRADYLAANYPGSTILAVDKEPNVYLELVAGRGDIAFGSSVVSANALLATPEGAGFEQVGDTIRLGGGSGVGIALRKGEPELRAKVNAALAAIQANGVYDRLAARYFDFDIRAE